VCCSGELLRDKGGIQIIEVGAVCVAEFVAVCVAVCVAVFITVCVAVRSCCLTKEAFKLSR